MARTDMVQLWDGRHVPGSKRGDLYVFGFRQAPTGLATRRQLRAMRKRPGRHSITARRANLAKANTTHPTGQRRVDLMGA
jgi:hypothetical protein